MIDHRLHLRLLAALLVVLLSPAALVRAQEGGAEQPPVALPVRPGGLDMDDRQAVQDRLKSLLEERNEAEKLEPDDGEKVGVLNTRIGVLESHLQLLEARQRAEADRLDVSEAARASAKSEAERALAAADEVDVVRATSRLSWPGWKAEELRLEIEKEYTEPLREARLAAERASFLHRQAKAELERIPGQQSDAEDRFAKAIARIRELAKKEREAEPDVPQKKANLLRSRIESWQQEAVHQRQRLAFLEDRRTYLEGAVELLGSHLEAATYFAARADALAAAAQAKLDTLLAAQEAEAEEKILAKRVELDSAAEEHRRLRLTAELENLQLEAELGRLRLRAVEIARRQQELQELREKAAALLESYETRYSTDSDEAERPPSEEVSSEIRRLDGATNARQAQREAEGMQRERTELESSLVRIRSRMQALEEAFAADIERARKAREEAAAARPADAPALSPWERELSGWEEARTGRTELLRDMAEALPRMIDGLAAAARDREKLHDLRRRTLLLLRRENLFLRGESRITWESFTEGLRDLTQLPGWAPTAASGVGRYLVAPERRGRLVFLSALIAVLLVGPLLLRRRLTRSLALRAEEEVDREVQRARIVVLLLLRALCLGLALFLPFLAASLLLPDPLASGVRRLLLYLGAILGGFWFARAVNRVVVRGESPAGSILPFEEGTALRLGIGISLVLHLSVVLVPLGLLLVELGYGNKGALELLSLSYRVLVGLVAFAVLFRRRLVLGLIPDSDAKLARLMRVIVTAIHPVVVLLIPALLILDVLRYDILAGLIAGVAVNIAVLAVGGYVVFRGALLFVDRRFGVTGERSETLLTPDRRDARQVVHFALRLTMLLGTVWAILAFSGTSLSDLRTFFSKPLPFQDLESESPATWWNLLVAAFLLYLTVAATGYLKKAVTVFALSRTRMDRGLQYTIVTLFGYVLVTTGLVLAARQLFDLTSFGYVVAALSVGIGFGLQEIVSNFISGIILLFERSLKVGDLIQVGDTVGVVKRIQVRSTSVLTRDNIYITVPNRDFMTQNLVNYVGDDQKMRLHVPVGVSYASDPDTVRETLLAVAKGNADVLRYPAPEVWFRGLGDSSLDFELLAWIREPVDRFRISSKLYFEIFAALKAASIGIPFPQRDLHLRSAEPIRLAEPGPEIREDPGDAAPA